VTSHPLAPLAPLAPLVLCSPSRPSRPSRPLCTTSIDAYVKGGPDGCTDRASPDETEHFKTLLKRLTFYDSAAHEAALQERRPYIEKRRMTMEELLLDPIFEGIDMVAGCAGGAGAGGGLPPLPPHLRLEVKSNSVMHVTTRKLAPYLRVYS
jgi:hypothetical protein